MPETPPQASLDLIQIVDSAVADAYRRSNAHLVCHPGCAQCCHAVFPISQEDAHRLREGLAALEQTDPEKFHRIQKRTAESLTRIASLFPGDSVTGVLAEDYEGSPLFADEDSIGDTEPCPALDPATGTCDLYTYRPIVCRTFGPPMRTSEGDLATCELCYTHATTEEIAACELDPTIQSLERQSNEAFDAVHGTHGETIVAYALRGV